MNIIDNKAELNRVFELHQKIVKDVYKAANINTFINQYYELLSSDDDEHMYIELSKTETISGHSEIIDW